MPKSNRWKAIRTKLLHWEYWPFSLLYFPVFLYYGWLVLRTRSFFFFTSSNPSIEFGGMFGEKKSDIFPLLPAEYVPVTFSVPKGDPQQALECALSIGFPVIAKPDIGERGAWVKKIADEEELIRYCNSVPVDFLIQEFVDHPIELGIFYVKRPGKRGAVTSVVRKEFLRVRGDGISTVLDLLQLRSRALLTADLESDFLKERGDDVPSPGEEVLVEPIGNHCRGTKFLNDQDRIGEELTQSIIQLADQIPDFYFGRFDIRCASYEDLVELKNFKILELNGAGAEPGHIYQPGYSLIKAYRDILWHLRVLADISIENRKRGVPYWGFSSGYKKWRSHVQYNRLLASA